MATEIQEPSDLPNGSITPATEDNFEILVYEKASDAAGIKKMAIAPWKDYLGFNSHKVTNVASYVGMPVDYNWEVNADNPYPDPENHKYTLSDQVKALSDKLGISTEPQDPFPTILPRLEHLEDEVDTADSGLMDRMTSAETDIDSLKEEIGSATPGSGSLTTRVNTLEGQVGESATEHIRDSGTELCRDVNNLKIDVYDSPDGLQSKVGALETTVGDENDGLVKDVADIQTVLGTEQPDDSAGLVHETNALKDRVDNLASNVYTYCGNITDVDDPINTTTIMVDGELKSLSTDVKNGNVFNIEPVAPAKTIKINGKEYDEGENIVWVIPEGGIAHFDELGANIDVSRIETIETQIDDINAKYKSFEVAANASWTTQGKDIPDGVYQFTLSATSFPLMVVCVFIAILQNDVCFMASSDIVKITSNFDTYWELDTSNYLHLASTFTSACKITLMKIGEI